MLRLDNISLIAVDCVYREQTHAALQHCLRQAIFCNAYFFSHERFPATWRGTLRNQPTSDHLGELLPGNEHFTAIQHVPIPTIHSLDDYSRFLLWDLPVYRPLLGDFLLTIQHDGFIVDPSAWRADFLQYDYIGAPWGDGAVGNGGFSLRSKRLLDALAEMREKLIQPCPEDVAICRTYRAELETRFGIVFAPREVADQFSVENRPYTNSFGYHRRQTEAINGWTSADLTKRNDLTLREQQEPEARNIKASSTDALAKAFIKACNTRSDINEHLDTLARLGSECEHITDFGARRGLSALAFLQASPRRLVVYNLRTESGMEKLNSLATGAGIDYIFRQQDVLRADIEETDLLFLDTHHSYDQVRDELFRHAGLVRQYIVLHDTVTFGENGEIAGKRGITPAIHEFLSSETSWVLSEKYDNNNGLMVLRRRNTAISTSLQEASGCLGCQQQGKSPIVRQSTAENRKPLPVSKSDILTLYVVTAVTRPANLTRIHESLLTAKQNCSRPIQILWDIVIDINHVVLSEELKYYLDFLPDTIWQTCGSVSQGSRGAPQKNHALDCLEVSGYIWFLDDDNLCHPDFLSTFADVIIKHPETAGVIFAQSNADSSHRLPAQPEMVRECGIDTAQFVLRRDVIGSERFDLYPNEDGRFIECLYKSHSDKFIFENRYVTIYNALK